MITGNHIPDCPTQFHIEITDKCNLACGFCPVHRMERGEPLSKDEILRLISEMVLFDPEYVDFVNYNEPLTCKHFWDYAELITDLFRRDGRRGGFGLVSNGTIMTEDIANRILSLHPKQVVFSVDAFTSETYAKVRPRWGSLGAFEDLKLRDTIYGNIDIYLDCVAKSGFGAWPVMEMVVCDLNVHEVEMTREYWLPRLHNQFLVINCTGRGGERAFTAPNDNPCRVILDGLWILSDGRVVACCEDWNGTDAVGNVREQSLAEIWNGDKIKAFRESHFSGRKCDIAVCSKCQTSQDTTDHYHYPNRTNKEVLIELNKRNEQKSKR